MKGAGFLASDDPRGGAVDAHGPDQDGRVLVVGAGPAGLVAAIELARRNVDVRVVDAAPGPASGSRGKGLQPRSVEVLDDLGIAGRILAAGRSRLPIRRYEGRTILGTSEVNPGSPEPTSSTPYPRTLLIPQWRVEETLRDRLGELGVRVEYGSKLVSLRQDGARVRVGLRCAAGAEEVCFAYVVGADGASSAVRRSLGIGFLGETEEAVRMLTADTEVDGLDRDFWHWWPGTDGGLLALCPLAATDNFQLQTVIAPDATTDFSLAEINRLVEERTRRTDIRVRRVGWQSVWRFNVRLAERYRVGRVFLAGDSAHVHPPAGGLGMNTGIQDAYNLAWKLGHVLRGAPEALLDTYEQERLPIAAHVLNLSSRLIAGRVHGLVPGQGLDSDTRQLTVHYGVSELNGSVRQPRAFVQAGDRVPDGLLRAPDGATVRIFDLLRGPHTTALAFGLVSAETATALAESFPRYLRSFTIVPPESPAFGDGNALIDVEGQAARDYAVDGDTLIIVRPDGYVGLRAAGLEELEIRRYLGRLLPKI